MMHPSNLKILDYTYELSEERIAKYPLEERDRSKLLVYNDGNIFERRFYELPGELPAGSLLIFNETRVVHARLLFHKESGGVIEVFCLEPHEQYADVHTAMRQYDKVWWKCMIGGASKWKHGNILSEQFEGFRLSAEIKERETGTFTVELSWDNQALSFAEVLQAAGKVPLPPYIKRDAQKLDEQRYQTVYAKEEGSVAAPTAGLHFTEKVFNDLGEKGIDASFVTLHVGAGTFKPVKAETMEAHEMHAECIEVSVDFIQQLISHHGKKIVAVGTTSLRTIESLYWIGKKLLNGIVPDFQHIAVSQWEPYAEGNSEPDAVRALQAVADYLIQSHLAKLVTKTQILIAPGYEFRIVNGLITNFHQPQSTLLLLVAAFSGNDWRKIYEHALNNEFRFLSYGDSSLLWREDA
jgi:S-adenosylmethionine:tRNA ribosyltransferase-isomerase